MVNESVNARGMIITGGREMMARLSDQIVVCRTQATLAGIKAVTAASPQLQREYQALQRHWLRLGSTLEFAQQIDGYLQWTARGLDPP
jgi:hypothetical protein